MKKKKTGFIYKYGNYEFNIYFRTFNNKIVKCFLIDEYGDQYCGIAKCNIDEGDIFNEHEGQRIALQKAISQREKTRDNIIKNIIKEEYCKRSIIVSGIIYKLNKLAQKEKI